MRPLRSGIWIDNSEAVIVTFDEDDAPIVRRIESDVDPRSKSRGGMSGTNRRVGGASHKKQEHRRVSQLSRFYDEVWTALKDSDQIAILGSGTAPKALRSAVESHDRHPEIVAVEPEQRGSEPQLVDRFRRMLLDSER